MFKIISKKTWNQLQPNLEFNKKLQEAEQRNKIIQFKLDEFEKLQEEKWQREKEMIGGYISISFNCRDIKQVVLYSWHGKSCAGCIQVNSKEEWQIQNKEILFEMFSTLSLYAGKDINISLVGGEVITKNGEEIFKLKTEKEGK